MKDKKVILFASHQAKKSVFEHAQNAVSDSLCACAKSHPGICFLLIQYKVSNDYVSGQ